MTCRNTGGTQSGGGLHKTGQLGGGMLRHSPNYGTLRLLNGDDDGDSALQTARSSSHVQ